MSANMPSSTKPEVHNVYIATPLEEDRATSTGKNMKFERAVFVEISEQTDRQTDRQTDKQNTHHNTSHPLQGRSNSNVLL